MGHCRPINKMPFKLHLAGWPIGPEITAAWTAIGLSIYASGALGSMGHIFYSVFFFFLFCVFMLNYCILVIWNYKNDKIHSFTLYIELCKKYVG